MKDITRDRIQSLAEDYITEGFMETTVLKSKFGLVDLNGFLVDFYKYVENWNK